MDLPRSTFYYQTRSAGSSSAATRFAGSDRTDRVRLLRLWLSADHRRTASAGRKGEPQGAAEDHEGVRSVGAALGYLSPVEFELKSKQPPAPQVTLHI